ncbi:MAG: type VI secretion system baseplate subunit TssG [Nannocystaceae bacterium]
MSDAALETRPDPGAAAPRASTSTTAPAWLRELQRDPSRADLVALTEALLRLSPGAPAVGGDGDPGREVVELRHSTRLGYQPGVVQAIERLAGDEPRHAITVNLLGLTGAATPLPLVMAEEADGDERRAQHLRRFLDVFHHRLLGLLVRGVASFEGEAGEAAASERLLALAGLAGPESRLPRARRLDLVPLVLGGARSPRMIEEAVAIALADLAPALQVQCRPFTDVEVARDPRERTRLGEPSAVLGGSAALGVGLPCRSGVTLRVGPLRSADARLFIPGAEAHARVAEVMTRWAPPAIAWHLELVVRDLEPSAGLGGIELGRDARLSQRRPGSPVRLEIADEAEYGQIRP